MRNDCRLLIHIGYAKAASTWLQTHLLGNQTLGFQMLFDTRCVRRRLALPSPFEFDADTCREYFESILQSVDPTQGVPVISCEGLTGSSRIGDYQRKAIGDRLVEVFPHAKIFLVFREQKSMQLAQYHQYLRRGGVYSLSRFMNPPMSDHEKVPYFDWRRFEYHNLLKFYHELFGRDQVLALPLEMLEQKPERFIEHLLGFCGMKIDHDFINTLPYQNRTRSSQSTLVMDLRRPLNFLFGERTSFNPRSIFPLRGSKDKYNRWGTVIDKRLPASLKKWHADRADHIVSNTLGDYYAVSNRKVCELTGIELEEFGYNVASASDLENYPRIAS